MSAHHPYLNGLTPSFPPRRSSDLTPVLDKASSTRPHSVACPLDASGLYVQSPPVTTTGAVLVASANAGLAAFAIRWNRGKISTSVKARSEEHTSELQSLMRLSYAVFCLKKKNKKI